MEYEKYIVPGNKQWSFLIGEPNILIQEIGELIILHKLEGEKLVWEKILNEIPSQQVDRCALLGEAEGIDLSHCLYLANKHCRDFFDVVAGYRRERPRMFFTKTRYDFYAAK
jgi:hypothetical protein